MARVRGRPVTSEWLPAATFAVGIVGTLGTQALRERSTGKREQAARTAEREIARNVFQRDTLLELQDVVRRLVENTLELLLHRSSVFEETGRWARDPYPNELSAASGSVTADMTRLRQRILDDALRQRVLDVQHVVGDINRPTVLMESDDKAKDRAWATFTNQFITGNAALEDHVGEVLRGLL